MNIKKITAIAMAAAIAAASVLSASAVQQLTEENPDGQTEVIAEIKSEVPPGVSYVIEIPDVIDFGVLTRPNSNVDSFVFKDYTVTALEVNGLTNEQQVSVYVRDENADASGDSKFYIANKAASDIKFSYDVLDIPSDEASASTQAINADPMPSAIGYLLTNFVMANETVDGSVRLNQNQLYPYNIEDIVGEYSGHMVFSSMITAQ